MQFDTQTRMEFGVGREEGVEGGGGGEGKVLGGLKAGGGGGGGDERSEGEGKRDDLSLFFPESHQARTTKPTN